MRSFSFESKCLNLGFSDTQLLNWALEPAEDEVLEKLFELGYTDAATWAELNPVDELVYDDTPTAQEISAS